MSIVDPPQVAPTAESGKTAVSTVKAGASVTLKANLLQGSGFKQVAFAWRETTNSKVTITDPKSATASFKAPSVASDTDLTFEITATDSIGQTSIGTISITVQPATVPNVVGSTQAAATTAITGAGLSVGTVTTATSTTVAIGKVISQNPASGASVAPGSAVNLVVSSGTTVPNVVGLTQAAAAWILSDGTRSKSPTTYRPTASSLAASRAPMPSISTSGNWRFPGMRELEPKGAGK